MARNAKEPQDGEHLLKVARSYNALAMPARDCKAGSAKAETGGDDAFRRNPKPPSMSFVEDAQFFANSISGGPDPRYDFSEFAGAHAKLFSPIVHFRRLGHVDLGTARGILEIILHRLLPSSTVSPGLQGGWAGVARPCRPPKRKWPID